MSRLPQIIEQLRTRRALIIIAACLLALNLGRLVIDHFVQQQDELDTRVGLLEQYRMSTRKLVATRARVARLKKQKEALDGYLINGKSAEEIQSRLQIKLQEQINAAGLQVESLRPVRQSNRTKEKDKDRDYDEISIKVRLSGSMNQFIDFLALLYKARTMNQLESLTLMPYKNKNLRIYFDYKGYYRISP